MKQMRISVLILNFFIVLLCVAAVGGYFTMPLIKLNVNATVTDGSQIIKPGTTENAEEIAKALDNVTVNLDVSLNTLDIFMSLPEIIKTSNESEPQMPAVIKSIIDSNVETICNSVTQQMNEIIVTVAPKIVANVVTEELYSELTKELQATNPEATEATTRAELAEIGINDEYISDLTKQAFDKLYDENATVESVSQFAVDAVREVCEKLQTSTNEQLASVEFTPEMKTSLCETIDRYAREYGIADENGSINMRDFATEFLLSILKNEGGVTQKPSDEPSSNPDSESGSVTARIVVSPLSALADETPEAPPTETSSQEELQAEIRALIYDAIPSGAAEIRIIMIVLVIVVGIVLLSMIPWVYLFIKVIVKSFTKLPAVKLKAPIIFGWAPFFLFMLLPNIAMFLVALFNPTLSMPVILRITVMSSSLIAFIAAVILFILSFSYGSLRKKMKVESVVQQEVESFGR